MRIVHRAITLAEAQRARDILTGAGIPSHIADERLWGQVELTGSEVIRVMVDNRSQERARQALVALRTSSSREPVDH